MKALIGIASAATIGLACLQYHWVGALERSERRARRESLELKLQSVAAEFDQQLYDIHKNLTAQHVIGAAPDPADWRRHLTELRQRENQVARSIRSAVWIRSPPHGTRTFDLRQAQATGLDSRPPTWTDEVLSEWGDGRAFARHVRRVGGEPALLVPVLERDRHELSATPSPTKPTISTLLIPLDTEALVAELRRITTSHFSSRDDRDYDFELRAGSRHSALFAADRTAHAAPPDATVALGRFLWSRWTGGSDEPMQMRFFEPGAQVMRRSVRVMQQRSEIAQSLGDDLPGPGVPAASNADREADANASWRLVAHHRAGSLEASTSVLRMRNLATGFAILLLLLVALAITANSATRARRLAAQQRAFAAGVSHELRTPLSVIASAAANLADGVVSSPSDVQRYGQLIHDRGRRLSALTERVLTLSGAPSVRIDEVDVLEIVSGSLAACSEDIRSAGATVDFTPAGDRLAARADAVGLQSAIENVVQNAVKHGGPNARVRVTVQRGERRGRSYVAVTVADQGDGIPPDERHRVFDPFFRGRGAIDTPGSGLGLSVAQQLVEAQAGDMSIRPGPCGGTVVEIRIPASANES